LAYKPGSVFVQSFIWDACHQAPQATYPRVITGYHYSSIWSCSRWGLQCPQLLPMRRCALTAPFHPYF